MAYRAPTSCPCPHVSPTLDHHFIGPSLSIQSVFIHLQLNTNTCFYFSLPSIHTQKTYIWLATLLSPLNMEWGPLHAGLLFLLLWLQCPLCGWTPRLFPGVAVTNNMQHATFSRLHSDVKCVQACSQRLRTDLNSPVLLFYKSSLFLSMAFVNHVRNTRGGNRGMKVLGILVFVGNIRGGRTCCGMTVPLLSPFSSSSALTNTEWERE